MYFPPDRMQPAYHIFYVLLSEPKGFGDESPSGP